MVPGRMGGFRSGGKGSVSRRGAKAQGRWIVAGVAIVVWTYADLFAPSRLRAKRLQWSEDVARSREDAKGMFGFTEPAKLVETHASSAVPGGFRWSGLTTGTMVSWMKVPGPVTPRWSWVRVSGGQNLTDLNQSWVRL